MDVMIRQSAGFGDIFFCQKIAKRLLELGHRVYWPVIPGYEYAAEYMKNGIIWNKPDHSTFELHLDHATDYLIWENRKELLGNVMEAKYMLANKHFPIGDYKDWYEYLKFSRDREREKVLEDRILKDVPREFALICTHFATEYLKLHMPISSDLPVVEIYKIPGFTLFDWCGVIEKASEIRIPDSSLPYMVEVLDTTDQLFMYKRNLESNIKTKKIWHKKWRFME